VGGGGVLHRQQEGFCLGAGKILRRVAGGEVVLAPLPRGPATIRKDSARPPRVVRGNAFRIQIWTLFALSRTCRSKCVRPMGWVFPGPGHF
jgi:hypothetical protein